MAAPHEEVFRLLPDVELSCLDETGTGGVLEPAMFSGMFKPGTFIDPPAEEHLRSFSFQVFPLLRRYFHYPPTPPYKLLTDDPHFCLSIIVY
jgi:hypothetical protein